MGESSNICADTLASPYVLVIDPDEFIASSIAQTVRADSEILPTHISDETEALNYIKKHHDELTAVALRHSSPTSDTILNELGNHSIAVIPYVLQDDTASTHDQEKELATDLVGRDSATLSVFVGKALSRLILNRDVTIIVADDSLSMRTALSAFLREHCYTVHEATDGTEVLELMNTYPETKVIITDNNMPKMDGLTLIKEIRRTFTSDELAVIGISGERDSQLSIKFITNGASDFLHKPFLKEELYCRVDHNVELLERIGTIRDLSNKDHLTKLFNRRYYFAHCDDFISSAADKRISVGMLDIDHFKRFNDAYGHDVGDEVLKKVSALIREAFSTNAIVARFGGEEFCILAAHAPNEDLFARYDMLRRTIESCPLMVNDEILSITISAGVCTETATIDERVRIADNRLYKAKESGRNRVVISS